MASNGNQNHLQSGQGSFTDPRLQEIRNISMLNAASNGMPLPSSYLQSYNCGYPPLPGRRNPLSSYGRVGMSNYYNPYSRYSTNMYQPGYRTSPYGQYGGGPSEMSSFIQMAEESTRPAFESIESVVEVVSSISMMLESTYHAVHSSYSAILGVVDQFSRLKDHLAQMLSILALLRGLRWLCLKVLYLMKLRKENPSDEAAWNAAEMAAGFSYLPPRPDKAHGSAWPFLMFVGLVIGAPWLMFKLLSKTVTKNPLDTKAFRDENGRNIIATTAFDFKATQRDELSFSAGERLYLSPSSCRNFPKGWMYACNSKQETGLIPSTYLVAYQKHMTQSNGPRNASQSFQQRPYENAAAAEGRGPFDYMTNMDEKFNEAFDRSKDSVENTNNMPTYKFSTNADEQLNSRPVSRGCLLNPAEQFNRPVHVYSYDGNRNEQFDPRHVRFYKLNPGEKFNRQPEPRFPQKPAEKFNPQVVNRDYSQISTEKFNQHVIELATASTRDNSQDPNKNFNAQMKAFMDSHNPTEKINTQPNDKAKEEVAKNQNMDTTET